MKFEEAIKSGKKIRPIRESGDTIYHKNVYFYFEGNILFMNTAQDNKQPSRPLDKQDYFSDWEIYEEETKTLSDKIYNLAETDVIDAEDVKDKLREFIDWMNRMREGNNPDKYLPIAKEIFGDKLTGG